MKCGLLDIEQLDKPYYAVVQLATQAPGVMHAVILRPDKVRRQSEKGGADLIVLGESPGDQANGWQLPQNVYVVAVIGEAHEDDKGAWECRPLA